MWRLPTHILLCCLAYTVSMAWAQTEPDPAEAKPEAAQAETSAPAEQTAAPSEEVPLTGGVSYQPALGRDNKLRDPFKSPFEIEQEEREKQKAAAEAGDTLDDRLPYSINELELRGIYYQAQAGYRAIFLVGNEYKWWSAGVKFQDADLVNITDEAVVFKQYAADDETQVREIVRELHRGEE